MISASQVAQARATSATFLTGAVTIRRLSGPATFDPNTGTIAPASGDVIYTGPASISDARDARTVQWGGQGLQEGQTLIRAPLDAQALPGDQVTIDNPGDYPAATRTLWVHEVKGRQVAVLTRIIATTTRPGDDG